MKIEIVMPKSHCCPTYMPCETKDGYAYSLFVTTDWDNLASFPCDSIVRETIFFSTYETEEVAT